MFKKATRSKVWLKIGIMGPSGSGKTHSALVLARGLAGPGGKIAGLDTENGSMSLFSHLTDFDVADIGRPFHPDKAIEAINAAVASGYKVIIIDSQSHFWKWILEFKESLDQKGGNQYTNWGKAKPYYDRVKEALLESPIHVIACMRAKDEYVVESNNGKSIPKKIGMGAINEPGAEYEYTVVFELAMDHSATATKDRTQLFDGDFARISEKTGERLLEWLDSADGEMPTESARPMPPGNEAGKALVAEWKLTKEEARDAAAHCESNGREFKPSLVAEFLNDDPEATTLAAFLDWVGAPPAVEESA